MQHDLSTCRPNPIPALFAALLLTLVSAPAVAGSSLVVNRHVLVSGAGTPSENCQGLIDTLASITDATADNPYLVKLEPGIYDCAETVETKSFVDLEGSGENVTRIRAAGVQLVLSARNDMEVRHLTVEADGDGAANNIAVFARDRSTLRHVSIEAYDADDNIGVYCNSLSSPDLYDVTIHVFEKDASGTNYGIASLTAAPQLHNVYIRVEDASTNYGVFADGPDTSEPTSLLVENSRIYVGGGSYAYGILSQGTGDEPVPGFVGGPVIVEDSTVKVYGALGDNHALHNRNAPLIVRNSTVEASGLSTNYWAIMNESTIAPTSDYLVTVDQSRLIGQDGTVMSEDDFTTRIGGSLVSGGNMTIDPGATVVCAGVWDESYTFSASSCP